MDCACAVAMVILALASIASSKPIMVSFGTNQGPIVPAPTTTSPVPPPQARRAPAPVSEPSEDVPNLSIYKPLVPNQYRTRLLSFRPNPNLILGTAQDQKYLSSGKFNLLKQQQARDLGLDYRGPQFFEAQEYELEKQRQQAPKQLFQPINQPFPTHSPRGGSVPEIGIVYSSGVRYYIPQFAYYNEQENSVYDKNDPKYLYYSAQTNKNY